MKFEVRQSKDQKRESVDRREIERRLSADGFGYTFSWTDAPGFVHPPHDHDYDHRVIVIRGQIEFTVNGQSYTLGPGDEIDLPHRTIHSARTVGDASVTYLIAQP